MNGFSSPSPIIITPVSNGWVVTMPPAPQNFNETQIFTDTMVDTMKKIKDSLQGENEIQEIINKAHCQQPVEPPPFVRDPNVHIFTTFDKVLAFLKVTIDE